MRSLFDIRRCRYCSLMVVISNMHCVDSREGDESARAEAGRVGAESASLPVTITQQPTSTFEDLRGMFNTYIADIKRQDEVRLQNAMMVKRTNHVQRKGFGQQRNNKDQSFNKNNLSCWNCGKQGHSSKECRSSKIGNGYTHKPKGEQSKTGFNKSTDDLAALHRNMAGAAIQEISKEEYAAPVEEESIEWLVDLGASPNICNSKDVFSQLERLSFPKRFRTASGGATVSEYGGKVTMKLPQSQHCLTLHNVVLMEDAPANLLSQGTLIEKGWDVQITKYGGMISQGDINIPVYKTGAGGTLRAFKLPLRKDYYSQAEQQEDAVSERMEENKAEAAYLTVQDKDTIQGWHNRLGHMGVSTIKKLATSGQLHITDKDTSTFKMEECEVCAIAKTTRLTFGDISVAAQEPLEIVHSDIAGPLKPDINGHIYYVTFVDDLTGLTCIGGLKTETATDVLGCFKNFKRISELAFNRKVQCLNTDGGGEYLGGMKPYLQLQGIVHQVTTPYTPKLNGTAERANRTLKEMCSSMLIAAKMNHKWWFYAMNYACTLINMGKQYQGRSLEEIMWKHKPGYGQVHPFGTEFWVRVPKEGRLKNNLTTNKAIKGKLMHPKHHWSRLLGCHTTRRKRCYPHKQGCSVQKARGS